MPLLEAPFDADVAGDDDLALGGEGGGHKGRIILPDDGVNSGFRQEEHEGLEGRQGNFGQD